MTAAAEKPWVLLRRGARPLRFLSRGDGQQFFDRLRFNGAAKVSGTLRGPDGEGWTCQPWRHAYWVRDDRTAASEASAAEDMA